MALIEYIPKSFRAGALQIIKTVNQILAEYADDGIDLTVRQMYYQFVARGLIENRQSEYKRLAGIIDDGRLAGLIDWNRIQDRTRQLNKLSTWNDPGEILHAVAKQYRVNPWDTQPVYVEVWIEKDAQLGNIENVCNTLRVPYFSCRGYSSQSAMWRAAQRIEEELQPGAREAAMLLHFGDHDPSGIDMTRDIRERLQLFLRDVDKPLEVRRKALNMDQIDRYNPPPNPAKESDVRSDKYIAEHGTSSWELDALDPRVIQELISTEVNSVIDCSSWDYALKKEKRGKELLKKISDNIGAVESFLKKPKK